LGDADGAENHGEGCVDVLQRADGQRWSSAVKECGHGGEVVQKVYVFAVHEGKLVAEFSTGSIHVPDGGAEIDVRDGGFAFAGVDGKIKCCQGHKAVQDETITQGKIWQLILQERLLPWDEMKGGPGLPGPAVHEFQF
jgi:hypothetical protein